MSVAPCLPRRTSIVAVIAFHMPSPRNPLRIRTWWWIIPVSTKRSHCALLSWTNNSVVSGLISRPSSELFFNQIWPQGRLVPSRFASGRSKCDSLSDSTGNSTCHSVFISFCRLPRGFSTSSSNRWSTISAYTTTGSFPTWAAFSRGSASPTDLTPQGRTPFASKNGSSPSLQTPGTLAPSLQDGFQRVD